MIGGNCTRINPTVYLKQLSDWDDVLKSPYDYSDNWAWGSCCCSTICSGCTQPPRDLVFKWPGLYYFELLFRR